MWFKIRYEYVDINILKRDSFFQQSTLRKGNKNEVQKKRQYSNTIKVEKAFVNNNCFLDTPDFLFSSFTKNIFCFLHTPK